jgi:diguanylate cyclase (GGDEF)-like protein
VIDAVSRLQAGSRERVMLEAERQSLIAQLRSQSLTDYLTGLPNRRAFFESAEFELAAARRQRLPVVAVLLDIDHFKQFNDRHGHPAGDACLRDVAMALQSALVRPGDMLVRYGGEEFIALLQDADAAACSVVAERLRLAVQALAIPHVDNRHGVVTVSLGAASTVPQTLPSTLPGLGGMALAGAAALVQAADRALYQAKQAGRNRVAA